MGKELMKESVPGIGTSGIVMCPYFRSACLKGGCELWMELLYDGKPVGRCSLAWNPKLMIELRESIDKRNRIKEDGKKETPNKEN